MKRAVVGLLTTLVTVAVPSAASGATITPNIVADDYDAVADANCSVREAVQSAVDNAAFGGCPAGDGGTDTIVLTADGSTDYTLTIGGFDENDNAEGDLDIGAGGPIVIRGNPPSATIQTIGTAVPLDRVIDVRAAGANLTLENLAVDGGDVRGAIDTEDRRGGAIASRGTTSLTLDRVTVSESQALAGGGLYYTGDSQVVVRDSTIQDNTAADLGGGAFGITTTSAALSLVRSTVESNETTTSDPLGPIYGGGIAVNNAGLSVVDSTITFNSVDNNNNGSNADAIGGGIRATGPITVTRSLLGANTAEVTHASAEANGGAIAAELGDPGEVASVTNSTIYDNEAETAGGGVWAGGEVDISLAHVTLALNDALDAAAGDHLHGVSALGSGTVQPRASIVPAGLISNACGGDNVASAGFNVLSSADAQCGTVATDSIGGPTGTAGGAPTDNGGATATIALVPGGRAVDLVPASECNPSGRNDQRGYPRPLPLVGSCDAGAYELHSCDGGATVLNGPYVPCFSAIPIGPSTPPSQAAAKKCKKPKKKKGKKAGAAAQKKPKGCKKKKRKKK